MLNCYKEKKKNGTTCSAMREADVCANREGVKGEAVKVNVDTGVTEF